MTARVLHRHRTVLVQDLPYGGRFWSSGCIDNKQCALASVVAWRVHVLVSPHGRVDARTAKTVGRAHHPLMFTVCHVLCAIWSPRLHFQGSLALCEAYISVALPRPVEMAVVAAQS
jgi:hypothetical protein